MELLSSLGRTRCINCTIFRFCLKQYSHNVSLRTLSSVTLKNGLWSSHTHKVHSLQNHSPQSRSKILAHINSSNTFCTSSLWLRKKGMNPQNRREIKGPPDPVTDIIDDIEDEKFGTLLASAGGSLAGINSVAVIQPWLKWGPRKRIETTPELLLSEACALIHSLPFMRVSYEEYVPLQQVSRSQVFGSGSLERLVGEVKASGAQAVFVSVDHLNRTQKSELESSFGMLVLDRFFVVLSIFKHHARTVEARLQIAMAEVPFMSKRCLQDRERLLVDERAARLKAALQRLSGRRERARRNREKAAVPTVAVVGYTNCGKTSMIRSLTGDERARGENRLFATLDVTSHRGKLPCGVGVIFLDSVGFIQNIPTTLIASFQATLQDAVCADVILLVQDVSHPDLESQRQTVKATLLSLPLPPDTPVVLVNNKADLLPSLSPASQQGEGEGGKKGEEEGVFASAVTGQGLNEVLRRVEREVLRVTGRKMYYMKLPTGSAKIDWLKEMFGVCSEETDAENPQVTHVHVVMNEAEKAAFRKAFTE